MGTDLVGIGDTTPGAPGPGAGGGSCGGGVSREGDGSRAGCVPGKPRDPCRSTAPGWGVRLGAAPVQCQSRQGQLAPVLVSLIVTPEPPETPPGHGTHPGGPAGGQGEGCSSSGYSGQGSGGGSCREWEFRNLGGSPHAVPVIGAVSVHGCSSPGTSTPQSRFQVLGNLLRHPRGAMGDNRGVPISCPPPHSTGHPQGNVWGLWLWAGMGTATAQGTARWDFRDFSCCSPSPMRPSALSASPALGWVCR